MKVIIFGAGEITERVLKYPLRDDVEILFICDNDENKWGEAIKGYTIVAPHTMKESDYDFIYVSLAKYQYQEQVLEQLIDMGVEDNKIILFHGFSLAEYCESELNLFFLIEKKELEVPFKKGPAKIYQNYIGETSKAHARREREGFFEKYCQGEGLDIGYGADLIVPGCSGWDIRNGDAQYMKGVEDESFDYVYSSHCLEHVTDVRVALKNWFRLVRKGGFLIITVPHRNLYEKKRRLPSRWNINHKHMFLIGETEVPDTLDIVEEVRESITGYDIKYIKACDEGHTITDPYVHSDGEYQIEMVIQKVK